MPYDAEGRWTPPVGWPDWKTAFVACCPEEFRDCAERFAEACERRKRHPTKFFDEWRFWYGGPFPAPNWPKHLTRTDWEVLANYAESVTRTLTEVDRGERQVQR